MMFQDAQRTLEQFLYPLAVQDFLDRTLVGGFTKIDGSEQAPRIGLLGADPEGVLIAAFHLAPKLTFHSANPLGAPPSLQSVADAADFRQRIARFHAANYSVRFPELRPLSPMLDSLARALEVLLHQPVTASAFWSKGGMKAPVHHDDHDLIVVHLRGAKRWYISRKPSELNNPWKGIPGNPPELGPHETIDVRPGDLLYLPRGTLHTVDSDSESLHLSIGFTPLTVREAVIAALDHLSDRDLTLRSSIGGRLAFQLRGPGLERLAPPVLDGAARLLAACRAPGFLAEAMQRRSSRTVALLNALPAPAHSAPIGLDTVLVQNDAAFCHLSANTETIDFSYPGGHLYIHRGAQESAMYVANTAKFRIRDIPGDIDDGVRLSLAAKFLEVGFLEVAS